MPNAILPPRTRLLQLYPAFTVALSALAILGQVWVCMNDRKPAVYLFALVNSVPSIMAIIMANVSASYQMKIAQLEGHLKGKPVNLRQFSAWTFSKTANGDGADFYFKCMTAVDFCLLLMSLKSNSLTFLVSTSFNMLSLYMGWQNMQFIKNEFEPRYNNLFIQVNPPAANVDTRSRIALGAH